MRLSESDILVALFRGLRKRCPQCGRGKMFERWYTLHERCSNCALEYETLDGNTWAFMYLSAALIIGVVVVGMFQLKPASIAVGQLVVAAVVVGTIGISLPYRKGVAVALNYLVDLKANNFRDLNIRKPDRIEKTDPETIDLDPR